MYKKKNGPSLRTIIIIFSLISLFGLGMMVYPIISSKYSESVRSEIHTHYEEVLDEVDTSTLDEVRAAAEDYNQKLFSGEYSPLKFEENGYYEQLKLPDTNVMCTVYIPKIGVNLPVYHSVSTESLNKGAGHMGQSSLPIGGINTHAVISAHTGMAQSPMFSDLELLGEGDIFQIKVLGETLTYEVEHTEVVLPQEVSAIKIQRDKDLVSLITCTPYGVNTHRLIVRGHRIETPEEEVIQAVISEEREDTASVWTEQYWQSVKTGLFIALGLISLFVGYVVFLSLRKRLEGRDKYEK